MIVLLHSNVTDADRARVVRLVAEAGASQSPEVLPSSLGPLLCLDDSRVPQALAHALSDDASVARMERVRAPYPLASLELVPQRTSVRVGTVTIGAGGPVIIAGPCSVESEEQIRQAARVARECGAQLLRGGAFKPRTSPYSFQGMGLPGLRLLAAAGAEFGLPVVSEVMEPGLVDAVAEYADVLQIGSRNMANFPLLRAAGRSHRPVLLKRGFSATIEEWLLASEYVLAAGNPNVILCERGIRGFDALTRNVFDVACVPLLRTLTHLPVVVDPSHATGRRDLVLPCAVAGVAAGADGIMIEMHPSPADAQTDRDQAIGPDELRQVVRRVRAVHAVLDTADDCLDGCLQSPLSDRPDQRALVADHR